MNYSEYIDNVESALISNREFWFPMNKDDRRNLNIRLGHEIGYGVASFDNYEKNIGETYGRLIVKQSFDSIGVAINAKDWINAINKGVEDYRN